LSTEAPFGHIIHDEGSPTFAWALAILGHALMDIFALQLQVVRCDIEYRR
jgi:hypothetical protein